jgi:hypothetical protein
MPQAAAQLTPRRVVTLLKAAGRRNDPGLAEKISSTLRAPALQQPAPLEHALGVAALGLIDGHYRDERCHHRAGSRTRPLRSTISTSAATVSTSPSWASGTAVQRRRPSGAASDTPTPGQCSPTPTNAPLPPTRRSALGDAEGSRGTRQWTARGLGGSPAGQGRKG